MSSTNSEHAKTNKNLFSSMFGNKLNQKTNVLETTDSASTMSGATVVQKEQPKSSNNMSTEEQTSLSDLMTKANTMPPEEFKAYLASYKENTDAQHRRQSLARKWNYSDDFVNNREM